LLLASDFGAAKATVLCSVSSSHRLVCAQSKLFWRGCPIFSPTEAAGLSVPALDFLLSIGGLKFSVSFFAPVKAAHARDFSDSIPRKGTCARLSISRRESWSCMQWRFSSVRDRLSNLRPVFTARI
jgi:hypothetical protein